MKTDSHSAAHATFIGKRRVSFCMATLVATAALALGSACTTTNPMESTASTGSHDGKSAKAGIAPGMNERGEVVDSAKVEMDHGTKVTGLDDQEGEVLGKPAPGNRFGKVKIGMDMDQVIAILGTPSDKGTRMSGTMFNPFYFGSDKYKREFVYKGMGRLVFGERGPWGSNHLIWIIHNANEPASR